MTDAELTALVDELSRTDPRSTPGVDAIFAVAAKLSGEPEFVDQPMRVVNSQGAPAVTPQFVAQTMLNIARAGKTATQAVGWFRKIPSITRGVGGAIKALYGITCTERIAMSDDVVLLPYRELPPSDTRDWILAEHDRANHSLGVHGITAPPQAALYRAAVVEPFFSPFRQTSAESATWFEDLDTASLLLAMTPKSTPAEAARWMYYDDPDIDLLGHLGITRSTSGDSSSFMLREPGLATPSTAAGLLTAYRGVEDSEDRERLRLALQRLIRSRNQLHPGNRAIDLAIAFEVLFMNQDRDEHSYKISLRAARLLRTSLADRRIVFDEIKAIYDIRSGMVHTGSASDNRNVNGVKRTAYDLVEAADALCSEALRRFVEMGHIPVKAGGWREIELS